ncbi:hypothetical protein CMUS01_15123 [Colletotrichum musicola]|uniref:Ankyrin repeat protein n=1 Tax=Colletotrichum musicola TaxID=2175873 RepID=A0A8H6MPB7_9PEZI|nr:hypothetical protein CMUS01_15123 [Colletotrichum musicola]
MEEVDLLSHITHPASVDRLFKHPRSYPALPEEYDWETQKQFYSPHNLLVKELPGPLELKHKFGYVFCHRGLYERASGIIDNSAAAIENGVREGLFLHEIDVFVQRRLNEAFLAHDKNSRRITANKLPWEFYSFPEILATALATRRIQTETFLGPTTGYPPHPDFASSYLEVPETISSLFDMLQTEMNEPVGRTLQIDLRDEDFAKAIAGYSYHLSRIRVQHKRAQGAHRKPVYSAFQATILKGYSKHYKSFDHLRTAVVENSYDTYKRDVFALEHLHILPPLVMGFFTQDVIALADETQPLSPGSYDRRTYEHIHDTFKKQVHSFVRVAGTSYNFILEIVHSGLGLGYDLTTNTAKSPLDGKPLVKKEVIFESLVDRAMIDVSLELRAEYPELLFSSCTRLPDVITSEGKFKAAFNTSRLEPWKDGEEGLSSQLRTIHGGLYPQSHLVVADDPAAEIAARTWIDQKSRLDRSDLLRQPYNEWLSGAPEVAAAIRRLNAQDFLPNMFGSTPTYNMVMSDTPAIRKESDNLTSSDSRVQSWLKDVLDPSDTPGSPDGVNRPSGQEKSNKPDREDDERSQLTESGVPLISFTMGGKQLEFNSEREAKLAVLNSAAYRAASEGDNNSLSKLLASGAGVDVATGLFATPLMAACRAGHYHSVKLLLEKGADVNKVTAFGSPLVLACRFGHIDVVKVLLTALKEENAHDRPDMSENATHQYPLAAACAGGHKAVFRLLLDRGADDDFEREAAFRSACIFGKIDIVDILLERKVNVNTHGPRGTALNGACLWGRRDVAIRLLENGAVVSPTLGAHRLDPRIVSLLEDAGVSVNGQIDAQPDSRGATRSLSGRSGKKISTLKTGTSEKRVNTARQKEAWNRKWRLQKLNVESNQRRMRAESLPVCSKDCFICNNDLRIEVGVMKSRPQNSLRDNSVAELSKTFEIESVSTAMVTVKTADGADEVKGGRIAAPETPGFGLDPRLGAVGKPVASYSW